MFTVPSLKQLLHKHAVSGLHPWKYAPYTIPPDIYSSV